MLKRTIRRAPAESNEEVFLHRRHFLACAASVGISTASAQSREIRIVVPYTPGGATDVLARMYADRLRAARGSVVVVENKPGAGGLLGVQSVQGAPADGHTLLFTITGFIQGAIVNKSAGYDPVRDFQPIARVALSPLVLGVPSSLQVNSLKELVALIRNDSKPHSYGNAGFGQTTHFYGEMLKRITNLDLAYVPYKGEAPFISDLIAGHVSLGFATVASMRPHIQSRRIIPLAVPGSARSGLLPQVPTLLELGYKGFESVGWFGLLAPAGTPRSIVEELNAVANQMLSDRSVIRRLEELGLPPVGGTHQEFEEVVKSDLALWTRIVNTAQIKMP